jgi:hypothetical protein
VSYVIQESSNSGFAETAKQNVKHLESPQDKQTHCDVAAEDTATVAPRNGANAMPAPVISYTKEERQLASLARRMAMNQNVLYHGTGYPQSILRTGVLFASDPSDPKVSLTRSPEVAAYFALLPRDDREERGAILIFDRERLRCRYRIYPVQEREVEIWYRHNEAEEELWGHLIDVSNYLIGFVSEPTTTHSERIKIWSLERRMRMEAGLDELLNFVPDWRCRPEEHVKSHLKKWELARNALFDGMAIQQAARQSGLSLRAARRLAGRLRRRVPCKSKDMDSHLNWSPAQIVLSWDLSTLLKEFQPSPNKVILPTDLVSALGAARINALSTYCEMSRDDVLNTLSQELPRLMQIDAQRKSGQAPTGSVALAALPEPSP